MNEQNNENKLVFVVKFCFNAGYVDHEERQVCYFETEKYAKDFVDKTNKDLNEWKKNQTNINYDFLYLPPFSDHDLDYIPNWFMYESEYSYYSLPIYSSLVDDLDRNKRHEPSEEK
jgi:hypothetical protein